MTRRECEDKLLDLAEQMYAVYKEYNPSGELLSVAAFANGYINVNDAYFSDNEVVLDANDNTFKTVDAVKYSSGGRRYGTTFVKGAFA